MLILTPWVLFAVQLYFNYQTDLRIHRIEMIVSRLIDDVQAASSETPEELRYHRN